MRWLTLWATLVVACFGLACAAALYDTRQDARRAARDATVNLSRVVADGIGRDIELVDLSLQSILHDLRLAENAGLDAYRRHQLLFGNLPRMRGIGALILLDASGNVLTDSRSVRARGMAFAHRDYFRVHKDSADVGLYVSRPFLSRMTGQWSIAVSRRIARPDGSFGGVVVGTLQVAYLENLFRQLDLSRNGVIALVRGDGSVIARFPAIPGMAGREVTNLKLFKHYPAVQSGSYQAEGPADGLSRLYAFTAVPSRPLIVVVGMADTDIYAGWRNKAVGIGLMTLLLCIGTMALVWKLRREFTLRLAAERSASRNEARYRVLAENSADMIAMCRADGLVTYISPAIRDVLGWAPADIEGHSINDFVRADYVPLFSDDEQSWPRQLTFPARHRDASWVWLEASVRRLPLEMGDEGYVLNVRDVSRRKEAEEALEAENAQLLAMAATDGLTNLGNRRRFDEALEREWRRALREQTSLALLLIDADHFKALNDHYGHQHGDQYLRTIAQLIRSNLRRPSDIAARYGGEEFAVLLPGTDIEGAYLLAENIRRATLDARIPHLKGEQGLMTVSIGVDAMIPEEGLSAALLVRQADAALYAAKRQGRNRTCVYEPPSAAASRSL
ncbi:MAG: diguanylate cyclase [Pigmentiphaga sp.]|uniref:diguanylate cyclase domain-containing protein n=1 Tax=Pigmentiphaga sp. TaxID=1977564 RepID=UPI0029AEE9AB|nr:diguanylate cyclase [Pigmentiphaga sp.]MDX3905696.1 diguanylate cyclase [Pigmentiphaga sp.]